MTLSFGEFEACKRVIVLADAEGNPYVEHIFNVHRWIQAYEGNEEEAAKVMKRHLHLRKVMGWCGWPEEVEDSDDRVDQYAPLSILGQNKHDDNKVVIFEQSGQIDIHGLIDNVKVTPFMRAKFRLMERIHRKVVELEKKTGKQSGGLLVMDLDGLEFRPSLLTLLAGPYRIMWGTLFEQYPQLIRHILIIRAPKFVNLLYSTCIPFIPSDYRSRMEICSSSDPSKTLLKHISSEILPKQYNQRGSPVEEGDFEVISISSPERPFPSSDDSTIDLNTISIPAGENLIKKYKWEVGTRLRFLMRHSQEFQFFIFFSKDDVENEDLWEEIYAGSERPALRMTDHWHWNIPKTGYYYLSFGNEKAWFLSVSVHYKIDRITEEGPIEERSLD